MANLSELRELLDKAESLEKEVTKLQKDRDELQGEKVTISASNKYAQEKLDKLKSDISDAELELKTTKDSSIKELSNVVKDISDKKVELDTSSKQLNILTSLIDTKQQEYDDLVSKKSGELVFIQSETDNLKSIRDSLLIENDNLTKKSSELRNSIVEMESNKSNISESAAKSAELSKKLAELESSISKKQDLLDGIVDSYDEMKLFIEKSKKEHNEFIEYEKNARKTLEAHEQAILDKEKDLKIELSKAQNRNRILDKTV